MAPAFLNASRWGTLLLAATLLSLVLYAGGVPGALLLGPMIGASAGTARMIMSRFARVIPPES